MEPYVRKLFGPFYWLTGEGLHVFDPNVDALHGFPFVPWRAWFARRFTCWTRGHRFSILFQDNGKRMCGRCWQPAP